MKYAKTNKEKIETRIFAYRRYTELKMNLIILIKFTQVCDISGTGTRLESHNFPVCDWYAKRTALVGRSFIFAFVLEARREFILYFFALHFCESVRRSRVLVGNGP